MAKKQTERLADQPDDDSGETKVIGKQKGNQNGVYYCARCAGPATNKQIRLVAYSTQPRFTFYKCPECSSTCKMGRPDVDIMVVKGERPQSRQQDDSEDARPNNG